MDLAAFAGVLGITGAGVGTVSLAAAFRRIGGSPHDERGPLALVRLYLRGRVDRSLEVEHRATIVALLSALPSGSEIVDQRPDGAKLTIRVVHRPDRLSALDP
jgi:hypothetical protein